MRPLKKEEELGLTCVGLLLCVVVRYYFGLIPAVIAVCIYAVVVLPKIRKSRRNQINDREETPACNRPSEKLSPEPTKVSASRAK